VYDVTPPDSNETRETNDSKAPKKKKVKWVNLIKSLSIFVICLSNSKYCLS
jgi:uncharacterized membrane protein YcfT